ncbi:hypothetical protein ACFQXB_13760 [Plastorhodobacter daqingensis]|uniref:Alkaline proteinase inhibitor/ Outer membrane lipoprotein Omp19 domain-containing protein n=1 Tax=Plastorhodobacter daqingensis TaxID=1387281 RepID=A0ABW2UKN1_9RHOB
MRTLLRLVPILLVVVACASAATPRPTDVSFAPNGDLSVRLSDWQLCSGPRTEARRVGDGWAGQLEGCAPSYSYEVALERNPIRAALGRLLGFFPGMGTVTLRDDTGRSWRFDVPPPIED